MRTSTEIHFEKEVIWKKIGVIIAWGYFNDRNGVRSGGDHSIEMWGMGEMRGGVHLKIRDTLSMHSPF